MNNYSGSDSKILAKPSSVTIPQKCPPGQKCKELLRRTEEWEFDLLEMDAFPKGTVAAPKPPKVPIKVDIRKEEAKKYWKEFVKDKVTGSTLYEFMQYQ